MKKRSLLPLVGMAIFLYILLNMDLPEIHGIMQRADWFLLSTAIIVTVPIVLLKSLKWQLLIKSQGTDYPLGKTTMVWLVGYSAGIVTPGRIGDAYKSYYLKDKMSMGGSLTTIVVDRVIDTFVMLSMAFAAIVFLLSAQTVFAEMLVTVVALLAFFAAATYVISKKRLASAVFGPMFRTLVPEKYKPKISTLVSEFYSGLRKMSGKNDVMVIATILGLASMLIAVLQYYLLALSLGIGVSFHFLLLAVPIVILLEVLPISFSGIGARDAALVFFFAMVGLSAEQAVSLSLLMLLVGYVLLGIIGMLIWAKFPPKKKGEA